MTGTAPHTIAARCCIAGGGPAGMMLGLLLARSGVDVVVLEKHADFLRDFRGDTIHPSTLEVMHELGVLDALLSLPHERAPPAQGAVLATSHSTSQTFRGSRRAASSLRSCRNGISSIFLQVRARLFGLGVSPSMSRPRRENTNGHFE
jgi:2-polyprenyl-6-methoxyphenol hydroxylase-like FAD-dependent oxidoreductase